MESAQMKTTIVTTTIHVPHFLTAYEKNIRQNGHSNVDFVVIGDKKTPPEAREFCQTIPNCEFVGLLGQEMYLQRFPELAIHIPFNSFERRDIGLLMAYEQGADVIITIDDDNLATGHDMIGLHHDMVCPKLCLPNVETHDSSSGWFNVCGILEEENGVEFYHRGYSPRHKWETNQYTTLWQGPRKVVVNAGLWLNNPDTDAITRLERKLNVVGFKYNMPHSIALAPGTWSPFNCQNTALARDVIPAYFMSPVIARHSDIFASYVINRIAEHLSDVIAFGLPLANHERSEHNLWHDVDLERWGMQVTDEFCDALRAIKLTGKTYHECFGEISRELEGFEMITEGMKIWHDVFEEIIR
jgi:reversibly glycosylated polypeptide